MRYVFFITVFITCSTLFSQRESITSENLFTNNNTCKVEDVNKGLKLPLNDGPYLSHYRDSLYFYYKYINDSVCINYTISPISLKEILPKACQVVKSPNNYSVNEEPKYWKPYVWDLILRSEHGTLIRIRLRERDHGKIFMRYIKQWLKG